MRALVPKFFTFLTVVALVGLCSGCGGGNRPFGKGSQAATAALFDKAPPVALLSTEGLPKSRKAKLTKYVAAEATKRGFAVNSKPDQRGYRMKGHMRAEKGPRGTVVVYVWDVTDSIGSNRHRITGQEIIPASAKGGSPWKQVDDKAMSRIAANTAERLAGYLGQKGYFVRQVALPPPDDSRQSRTAANGSARLQRVATAPAPVRAEKQHPVAIASVKGVNKASSKSLVKAMGIALDRRGFKVGAKKKQKAVRIAGSISVGPKAGGQQPVSVQWKVLDSKGALVGTVKQNNKIPAGSVDAGWGPIAQIVADAAAGGIVELLVKAR